DEITDGAASPAVIGALLTGLRMKGETPEEVTGFARVMRAKSIQIKSGRDGLVDTCGTGGGGLTTFNISTTAAFVVAGAGVPVAEHGHRRRTAATGLAELPET